MQAGEAEKSPLTHATVDTAHADSTCGVALRKLSLSIASRGDALADRGCVGGLVVCSWCLRDNDELHESGTHCFLQTNHC
jgi:hypothetical protein